MGGDNMTTKTKTIIETTTKTTTKTTEITEMTSKTKKKQLWVALFKNFPFKNLFILFISYFKIKS